MFISVTVRSRTSREVCIENEVKWCVRDHSRVSERHRRPRCEHVQCFLWGGPVATVPGIKALLSARVAEALLVAAGLAGVRARALRLLLDGNWRAVKCHRCKRHTDTEGLVYTKHLHTAGFVHSFHTRPRRPSPSPPPPPPILRLLSSECKKQTVRSAEESLLRASQKCLSDCEVAGKRGAADRQSNKWTLAGVQTTVLRAHTHRHTLQHSSSCLAVSSPTSPHSSRHNSSQNFPFVKVKLKAKQLHGPERCLWTDESQCHTSIRAAHIHPSPSLNIPSSWYPDVGNVRHTRGGRERKEGKDSWGRAVS